MTCVSLWMCFQQTINYFYRFLKCREMSLADPRSHKSKEAELHRENLKV